MIANYGFVPETTVSKSKIWNGLSGHGAALDRVVLGQALPFKARVDIRIIGVLTGVQLT